MRVVVTIAALNEARNLPKVLSRMPADVDVILIDDGSTDETVTVARSFGAQVVRHPINLGQGRAVITGFRAALMGDWDVVVEMDGDGQHNPEDIPRFLDKLEAEHIDVVVGSRILGTNYSEAPFFRRTMLPVFTAIINGITGFCLTDSMCGYRAFRLASLRRVERMLMELQEPQYLAAEMFIRLAQENLKVEEIPIDLAARHSGTSYKGLVRYGWGVTMAVLKTVLSSPRPAGPGS